MKFRAEHTIRGVSVEQYEHLYFDESFNQALCEHVKLARTLLRRDTTDGHLSREVKVGPDREIPAPVAKILGANRIEYTECVEYDFGSYTGTWKTISSLMTDKVDSHGTFAFKSSDGGVLRIVEGDVKVKVFGVGGVIERFIVADVERSYQQAADFTQKWIDGGNLREP